MTFQNILVALDTLRPDHPALYTAKADFPEANLHLLHVVPPLSAAPMGTLEHVVPHDISYELGQQSQANADLQALGQGEVVISPLPAAEVLERARSGKFDLIMLGTSTKGGLERLMLGSVASTVVSESPVPVLTVGNLPPARAARPPMRVLVLQDFSPPAQEALNTVQTHFPHAQLDMLHAVPPGTIDPSNAAGIGRRGMTASLLKQRRTQWVMANEARLAELGGGEIVEGDPADIALERAASGEYDLIALGTSSKSALERLFFGSVAQRVVRESPIPVLTVHSE